jgi:DNA-binding Xre family transcriptional regulator
MLLRMMKIKIAETAQKHDVKSAYALQKALDLSPTIAARLWKGEFSKIGVNTLEKLCELFKCQTDDLLEYPLTQKSNAQMSNDTQKGNTVLSKPDAGKPAEQPQTPETTVSDKGMTTEQVAKRLAPIAGKVLSNRRILDYVKEGKLNSEQSGKRAARFFSESDYAELEIYYRNSAGKSKS